MKEFKLSEKLYIAKNANSKTLEEMSTVLDCELTDVKKCFENMKKTGEYDKYRVAKYDEVYSDASSKPNSLLDLSKCLFDQLDVITNKNISQEELKKESERSKLMVSIAQTIINNEKLLLDASKHFKHEEKQVRQVLGCGNDVVPF